MSHIVSLRGASLRALRSSSTMVSATKCAAYSNRSCQHQQQCSYSTLSSSPNRILINENNKSTKRTLSDQTLSTDPSHSSVFALTRHLHTSSILYDSFNVSTPSFPESVKDGTIRLLKKVGDKVAADETIAEIETDKSALSVNSPKAGVIEAFLVADGDNVTSGAQVAKLTSGEGGQSSSSSSSSPQPSEQKPKQETKQADVEQTKGSPSPTKQSSGGSITVSTPSFPESVKDGVIRLTKKVGDKISADETIAEIETDKSNLSVNSPSAGVIEAYLVSDGDTVVSGAQVAKVNTSSDAKAAPSESKKEKPTTTTSTTTEQRPSPKPSSALTPSEGTKRDTSAPPKPLSQTSQSQISTADANKITGTRSETRVKMSRMRMKIAERLKDAQNTCAMLTTFNEIDMSNLVEFRKKYADQFVKRHNLKLGFMSAFVKASACALVDSPIVNAVIDGNEIVYRDYVDISVAVASPKGLVVPVLRNVERMSFADIERTISEFGEKAKKGSLAIEDMDGGTFTISNGGVFGSLFGTPIINPPQSAILGMHGIFDRPVAVNGKIEIRPMMYVALTYDHRILDGRDAVLFLRKIKQYVEDSRTIFLNL